MTTYRLIQSVPVKEIDVESENYCFDFVPRLSNGETIALFPPVLYSEKGRLQPILGRNQLHRSREKTSVLDSALVLEGTSLGLETVLFSISLKQSLGGFTRCPVLKTARFSQILEYPDTGRPYRT
jgi:hypothetical protein